MAAVGGSLLAQHYTPPQYHSVIQGDKKSGSRVYPGNPDLAGWARYRFERKLIELEWTYHVPGLEDGPMPYDRTRGYSRQQVALAYWPTEVVCLRGDRFAVAGVSERGRVLIEVFTLETVKTPALIRLTGGGRTVPYVSIPISSVVCVLDEQVADFGEIVYLFPNLGAPGRLFFQTRNSGDIFDLDLESEAFERVASAGPAAADVLTVPHLAQVWVNAGAGMHRRLGCMYWFFNPGHGNGMDVGAHTLILRDADNNGVLESSSLERGWSDELSLKENWVPGTSR